MKKKVLFQASCSVLVVFTVSPGCDGGAVGFLFVFIPPAVEASTAPFSSPVSPLFSLLPAGSRRQLELVSRGLKRSAGTAGMGV